jgi:hypothetical protein
MPPAEWGNAIACLRTDGPCGPSQPPASAKLLDEARRGHVEPMTSVFPSCARNGRTRPEIVLKKRLGLAPVSWRVAGLGSCPRAPGSLRNGRRRRTAAGLSERKIGSPKGKIGSPKGRSDPRLPRLTSGRGGLIANAASTRCTKSGTVSGEADTRTITMHYPSVRALPNCSTAQKRHKTIPQSLKGLGDFSYLPRLIT